MQLPPGGVVSRLTLWVNGEEREAAFAGRGQTRQAYQQVVRTRRDPVLVTTSGRDRVLVQCFPVPPDGGEMKIRFGVTAPLAPEDRINRVLRLPHFLDRNFGIPDDTTHAVWFEAKNPLGTSETALSPGQPKPGLYSLRGDLKDDELSDADSSIRARSSGGAAEAWAQDTISNDGSVIRQFVGEEVAARPSRIVLVIDTSRRVGRLREQVAAALKTLPPGVEVKLLPAGGNGVYEEGASLPASSNPEEIAGLAERLVFEGGADNVEALGRAWDVAAETPRGVVVWVHGPQPFLLRTVEELRQRWERRPDGPTVYAVQTEVGPDRVSEKLDGVAAVERVQRVGHLQSDLENLFARLDGRKKQLRFVRVRESARKAFATETAATAKETSAHLARLWANDEVALMLSDRRNDMTEEAVELAARYQLVTPVSGAVVLETQEQYRQAGLQPVDAGSVPTIPEPETVLLLAVAAAILAFMFVRGRPARRSAT